MWTCSKCNTPGIDDEDVFCFGCGEQRETTSLPETAAPEEIPTMPIDLTETATPVDLSFQQIVPASTLSYDASAFASQFPPWDLQPPAGAARKVRRSI